MIKKTIRYTTVADAVGWECYYALQEKIDGQVRMWTENGLIVMEYDTIVTFEEIFSKTH